MCVSYLVKTVYFPAGLQVDFNISVLSDEHGTADGRALVAELALQNISDEALLVALNGALSSEGPGKEKKERRGKETKAYQGCFLKRGLSWPIWSRLYIYIVFLGLMMASWYKYVRMFS